MGCLLGFGGKGGGRGGRRGRVGGRKRIKRNAP